MGAFGLIGSDMSGDEFILVAFEQRETMPGFESGMAKDTLERLHLERYRYDHILRRGTSPFDSVRAGGDPPDFVVTTDAGNVLMDCVAFALQGRRNRYHLFDRLQERLAAGAEGRDFSGLAGSQASVWFGEHMDEKPPAKWDDTLVTPLLDLLAETRVDYDAVWANRAAIAEAGGLPDQATPGAVTRRTTADGEAGFVANVLVLPEEAGDKEPGFGVDLHLPQQIAFKDAREELERVVAKHDKAEIESLLITAGGPDRRGHRCAAEEVVAWHLVQRGEVQVTAERLARATIHLWGQSEIYEIPVAKP